MVCTYNVATTVSVLFTITFRAVLRAEKLNFRDKIGI